jgi:hypothetical protein
MSGALSPLNLVLRDLVALARRRATGLFCIVTEDNRFASIKLREGKVLEVMYRSQFNEAAVEMLAQIRLARATFQAGVVGTLKHGAPGESAVRWLLGGFENQTNVALRPPSPSAVNGSISDVHKRVIEEIAMGFLGPIASVVCDGVFETTHDLDAIIREIGANLTDSEEAARFGTAVRGALGAR